MDHATAECYVMERRRWELCIFGCCGPLHVQYCCSDPKEVTITLIASLVGGALFISILMIILSCCFKRRDKNDGSGGNDSQSQPCESAAQQCMLYKIFQYHYNHHKVKGPIAPRGRRGRKYSLPIHVSRASVLKAVPIPLYYRFNFPRSSSAVYIIQNISVPL